jgi:hypothetical protein
VAQAGDEHVQQAFRFEPDDYVQMELSGMEGDSGPIGSMDTNGEPGGSA